VSLNTHSPACVPNHSLNLHPVMSTMRMLALGLASFHQGASICGMGGRRLHEGTFMTET
jgi:hypothetical protein